MNNVSLELTAVEVIQAGQSLFKPITLNVEPSSIVTVMGPSGCGKSTLLNAITGSLAQSFQLNGEIRLNGEILNNKPIEDRHVGILFQDDLLFPHLDVFGNLAFGIPQAVKTVDKKQLIESALERAGLSGFEHRDIATLSGGQKARISLLRCLLSKPSAILLDEPFSKLDTTLRASFREFVFEQVTSMNIPALLVTHDIEDCAQGLRLNLEDGSLKSC